MSSLCPESSNSVLNVIAARLHNTPSPVPPHGDQPASGQLRSPLPSLQTRGVQPPATPPPSESFPVERASGPPGSPARAIRRDAATPRRDSATVSLPARLAIVHFAQPAYGPATKRDRIRCSPWISRNHFFPAQR